MSRLFFTLVLCLSFVAAAQAQEVVGDWEGTLKVGPAELRLALHVTKAENDGLKATFDSIDQNAMGIPVTSVTYAAPVLKFELEPIRAAYEGKLSADGQSISGTWSQGGASFPLDFKRAAARAEAKKRVPKPSEIDGDWEGTLEVAGQRLRLALHVVSYEDGMTATLDSFDQNLAGVPVTTISRDGVMLKFEMKQFAASYSGTIDKDFKSVTGTWEQSGASFPLVWKRKGAASNK